MTSNRKKKIIISVIGLTTLVVGIIIWIGISIPTSVTDGIENFSGDEQVAAIQGLKEIQDFYRSGTEKISAIGTYKYRVTAVRKLLTPTEGIDAGCGRLYEVEVSRVGLFGAVGAIGGRTVCLDYGR